MEGKELMIPGTPQNFQKYLFSEDIKKKFEVAVPKWLSVDRLLRVVFTSVMRNPKLLQCTTESLLSSIMQCAQLGLEPILGRAHLIPYRNNKKPGKPLECQFQPGYQGLVDLAERSGKVETVKAHVVYENDDFEIEYGLNERLVHRPKMDGNRGKPIGSYTVWTRKSGAKTYTFMLLDDIYRDFRSKSVAYNYAIKDKREDTPWIENEPEMLKKSLVKRHSKLEPASVDFMEAVEIDNMVDIGGRTQLPFFNGSLVPIEDKTIEEAAKHFDEKIAKTAITAIEADNLNTYLSKSAEHFEKSIEEIKAEAIKDFDGFWKQFEIWEKGQQPSKKKSALSAEEQEIRAGFINVKKPGTLRGTEEILRPEIPNWSKALRQEWDDKWLRIMREPYELEEPEVDKTQEEKPLSQTEESPDPSVFLNCPETYEERPEKNEEGRINIDVCDNACSKKQSCLAYTLYHKNALADGQE